MNWVIIALRNLSRNKGRTGLASSMVGFAVALTVFLCGMEDGIEAGSVEAGTSLFVGQLQITKPGYDDNPRVSDTIPGLQYALSVLSGDPDVVSAAARVEAFGLLFGPEKSAGTRMIGLDVPSETLTTRLHKMLKEGRFIDPDNPGSALIGSNLARQLGVGIGDSMTFITQAADGSIGVGSFILSGIIETGDMNLDSRTLLVNINEARATLAISGAHRLVARTRGAEAAEPAAKRLRPNLLGLSVLSWETYMNIIKMMTDIGRAYAMIVLVVFLLLAVAGISNVMIVSVSERTKELGIIMAMGAHRRHVAFLILMESFFIGFFGVMVGVALGIGIVAATGVTGIDLSAWSRAIKMVGWPDVIYPRFGEFFLQGTIMTCILSFLAALVSGLFPAVGSARLEPARAMRQV
ncbi:MAG: FtsX-like permease family protein [candidate division WOR-3 bacterium]